MKSQSVNDSTISMQIQNDPKKFVYTCPKCRTVPFMEFKKDSMITLICSCPGNSSTKTVSFNEFEKDGRWLQDDS